MNRDKTTVRRGPQYTTAMQSPSGAIGNAAHHNVTKPHIKKPRRIKLNRILAGPNQLKPLSPLYLSMKATDISHEMKKRTSAARVAGKGSDFTINAIKAKVIEAATTRKVPYACWD